MSSPNLYPDEIKKITDNLLIIKNFNLQLNQQQSEIIDKAFEDWKGDLEQVDDVCVIGIRV